MVDFVCPECGSVDHVNGLVVRYPYQCPGCDRVIHSARPVEPIDVSSQATSKRVRVTPLRTKQWARPASRKANRTRPSQWVCPVLVAAVAGGALFVWLRIPIPPEDFHPAAAQEPAAQRPSPDSDRISGPDVSPSAPNTAEMAPASDREIREEHAAGAMERANPDGRSDPRTMHVDPEPDAFQPSLDPAHASDGGHSGAGSGLNMATPLFAGVPILNRPNWSGRQIQAISDPDPLLIVDNPPYREWVRVLDVHSGNIGWVRKDEVRISAALK